MVGRKKQYFPLVDYAKFFCALLVVLIHCLEISEGHPVATFIVQCFSSQAVPFFMIVSGFFVADKIDNKVKMKEIAKLCIKNWLSIYLAWAVLWLPYYIQFYSSKYPNASIVYICVMILRRFLFAGQGV